MAQVYRCLQFSLLISTVINPVWTAAFFINCYSTATIRFEKVFTSLIFCQAGLLSHHSYYIRVLYAIALPAELYNNYIVCMGLQVMLSCYFGEYYCYCYCRYVD